jgi:hypothetical protein
METLPKKTTNELLSYYESQELLLLYYVEKNSLEMMWLVKWTILECFVKKTFSQYRIVKLNKQIQEWSFYLNGGDVNKPAEIKNFSIEPKVLPNEHELREALEYYGFNYDKVWQIFNPKGIYKKYRNDLAHRGEKISKSKFDNTFKDLTSLVDYWIAELHNH